MELVWIEYGMSKKSWHGLRSHAGALQKGRKGERRGGNKIKVLETSCGTKYNVFDYKYYDIVIIDFKIKLV